MTGKRFTYEYDYDDLYNLGFFLDNGKEMLKDDILNTLNNLNEENEQLKETNQKLYDELQETMSYYSLKMGEVSILKRKNEQLKFGNKNLEAILNDFINILNRLQANPNDKHTVAVARDMLQNMGKELRE